MRVVRSACFALIVPWCSFATAQSPVVSRPLPFRPLGSPSLVDVYPGQTFASDGSIRQVAAMQGGFQLPPSNFALPPNVSSGNPQVEPTRPPQVQAPPMMPAPNATPLQPRSLPTNPSIPTRPGLPLQTVPSVQPGLPVQPSPQIQGGQSFQGNPPARSNPPFQSNPALPTNPTTSNPPMIRGIDPRQLDYQPVPPPQIGNSGFATMSDCNLITPPSGYTALSPYGCGNVVPTNYAQTYVPPPAQIAGPAVMPPLTGELMPTVTVPTGVPVPSTAAPAGSLMTFGQETYPVQVGQGLWGQPVAYVPGQRFRNWLRYLSF